MHTQHPIVASLGIVDKGTIVLGYSLIHPHCMTTTAHHTNMANSNHNSRPGSPTRHTIKTLPDIPEVVPTTTPRPTPGPNAFAQQADKMERHKLEGNAFYQQEVAKRKATPPTMLHPALRSRSDFQPTSSRGPEMMQVRDSRVTTMSAFIDAGKENSPPLKLLPPDSGAFPTRRGVMEEQREQLDQASTDQVVAPVFKYTPKIPAESPFSKSIESATATPKKKGRVSDTAMIIGDQTSSPKKGFREKFRLPNLRATPTATTANLSSKSQYDLQDSVPPKAKAVLGSSPPKSKIPRSPSKKMAFFSRKHSEPVGSQRLDASAPATDGGHTNTIQANKTPQTASSAGFSECHTARTAQSDPTYYRQHQSKRVVSHSQSERGADKSQDSQCMVTRSQSLQYFNRERPPTPPAKNTPPHEKEQKESAAQQERQAEKTLAPPSLRHEPSLQDDTPTRETVRIIQDGRTSPTRFGGYAHVENPTVVKKPSVYSMHASVFPDLDDASSYDEIKSRVEGLGLEGLSDLPESFYHRNPNILYSPSIYSTEWASSPHARFRSTPNLAEKREQFEPSPAVQASIERHRATASTQTSTTKKSGSSNGTIPFVYPDLASDPSLSPEIWQSHFDNGEDGTRGRGKPSLHGRAHSLDHSNYNRDSMYSIFARSAEDLNNQGSFSPIANHPSAAPSPLQYLPATVYTPPPRMSRGSAAFEHRPNASEGSPHPRTGNCNPEHTNTDKPSTKRQSNPFDNLPSFPAHANSGLSGRSTSSHSSPSDGDTTDTDPTKITPTSPTFPEGISSAQDSKMDAIMAMLSGLASQNENIARMRDDICALNARLGKHTGSESPTQELEQLDSATPQPAPGPYVPHGTLAVSAAHHRDMQSRVDLETNEDVWPAAFDLDRRKAVNESAGLTSRPAPTPRPAPETPNAMEQLIDIVGGFAKRMDAIEAMMQRQSGEKRDNSQR